MTSRKEVTNITKKQLINSIIGKKTRKKFLSENQKNYYNTLINNEITICSGPAGVGKSFIAMRAAIDLLLDETNSC
jgi:phosphate starvation-inducible protein PhoH